MDDTDLVSRAVGGDRDAFAAIYDRYAGAVLDLCTAVLRDGDEAAEATLDSFLRAARELVNLRDRSRLRTWLLAVARQEASARAQRERPAPSAAAVGGRAGRRATVAAGAQAGATASAGRGPSPRTAWPSTGDSGGDGSDDDPRAVVWDPVAELSETDRAVLHLNLRHQLEGEELGDVLGVRVAVADARAARLRVRAETSVGAMLLSRADSGADPSSCKRLAEVLEGWDGRFTPAVGSRVNRHARRCDACQERRTMLLGRLREMASLPFLPPPPWLRQEVLLRMELAVSPRLLAGWNEDGFPPGIGGAAVGRGRRTRIGAVLVAVGVAVFVIGFLLRDDGSKQSNVASSDSTATLPTVPFAGGATATTVPAAPGVTVGVTDSTVVPTTTVPAPATTLPVPATTFPVQVLPPVLVADRDPPAIAVGADSASAYVAGCSYSVTGVSADVSDRSPVNSVTLFVRSPDGIQESMPMSFDGGRWRATVGNFQFAGQAIFWAEAVDSAGNPGRSGDEVLAVYPCG